MRQISHTLAGVACWIVVVGLWVMLIGDGSAGRALQSTLVQLAAVTGAILAVTIWWVRHNVGIYRRKGPRRELVRAAPRTDEDRLGRAVRWSLPGGALAAAQAEHLVIEVDGDLKTYRRGG
jgi:hypothetical protein